MTLAPLGWLGIVRLGLAQAALGAIVVLTTSTINRVMVVEYALPAMLPGALVGYHYALQLLRPRMGHGSDVGGRSTPWIIGGIAVLGLGGFLAAVATVTMGVSVLLGTSLAIVAFTLIGAGVSAAGTSLLVLLAKRVVPHRRPAAATIVWLMMIAGFAVTATVAGQLLDPFSPLRLVAVSGGVSLLALLVTLLAVWNVEKQGPPSELRGSVQDTNSEKSDFRQALAQVWAEPQARRFTAFVFVSMFAYSMQDLILEPFAGAVFAMTPGQSTKLGGLQHGGVFCGMVLVAVLATAIGGRVLGSLRGWIVAGCIASAGALLSLAAAGVVGPGWPLQATVFILGLSNGAFAIAAIGSMMMLAGSGRENREGVRMGLWGAAQAIAFALGGFFGAVASDAARMFVSAPGSAYSMVFLVEAIVFLVAALMALRIGDQKSTSKPAPDAVTSVGRGLLAEAGTR